MRANETAILMASGMGTRLRPLTDSTPKPLVEVGGRPMIETIIEALEARGVGRIVVVVGYLGDQFDYLREKYPNIAIVHNEVYETVNNISSVYAARDYLKGGNCFICEADLYVSDPAIFDCELPGTVYFGKYIPGHSDDWVFDTDSDGIITRIGKYGDDCYNMCGISYFTAEDALTLYNAIVSEYGKPGYETLFWDDVVNMHIKDFKLRVHPVQPEQIIEIDTYEEWKALSARL